MPFVKSPGLRNPPLQRERSFLEKGSHATLASTRRRLRGSSAYSRGTQNPSSPDGPRSGAAFWSCPAAPATARSRDAAKGPLAPALCRAIPSANNAAPSGAHFSSSSSGLDALSPLRRPCTHGAPPARATPATLTGTARSSRTTAALESGRPFERRLKLTCLTLVGVSPHHKLCAFSVPFPGPAIRHIMPAPSLHRQRRTYKTIVSYNVSVVPSLTDVWYQDDPVKLECWELPGNALFTGLTRGHDGALGRPMYQFAYTHPETRKRSRPCAYRIAFLGTAAFDDAANTVSHLCHNPRCFNWNHHHLESLNINKGRAGCPGGPSCRHKRPCLIPGPYCQG